MAEYYLSPAGNDAGSGSRVDPWRTLTKAIASVPAASTVYLLGGDFAASSSAFATSLRLEALEPSVIRSSLPTPAWSQVLLGTRSVWHAAVNMSRDARQGVWRDETQQWHRLPVWTHAAPLFDTAAHWAESVLNDGNRHLRWGLWSTAADLYLISPPDGAFTDPNHATVTVSTDLSAVSITGPDITLAGPLTVVGHQYGVRIGGMVARTHLDGISTRNCNGGVSIIADLPAVYSHDNLIEHCRFEDDLLALRPGETKGNHIPWNVIKAVPLSYGVVDASGKPITAMRAVNAESVGIYSQGGSINTVVQDCVVDGAFDGTSHYMPDDRYDANADTNLTIRRCHFENIVDDSHDRSRYQNGVVIDDCTHFNVGSIISPAPLWGSVTLRNCRGWLIGEQVRVPDGNGNRPPGSVVKMGSIAAGRPQGLVRLEDCQFYSETPTTQGISQDGGLGSKCSIVELKNTAMLVGYIVVNWPYTADWFHDLGGNVFASAGTRPLKTSLPIELTPFSAAKARYYDPTNGNFEDATMIEQLQIELAQASARIAALEQAIRDAVAADAALAKMVSPLLSAPQT